MRVVFCNRPDWQERSGGDVVQMLATKKALEAFFGITVHIASGPADQEIAYADLVHVFNVQDPELGLPYLQAAKAANRPTALSTIFWDLSHAWYVSTLARLKLFRPHGYWRTGKSAFDKIATTAAKTKGRPKYYSPTYRSNIREMVELADIVLPNSDEEGVQLARYIGCPIGLSASVVNALDLSMFSPSPRERKGIVMAARIDPIKNVMGVLSATERLSSMPITIAGQVGDPSYAEAVGKVAGRRNNVTLLDKGLPHAELPALYQSASVHVLPSFRESPGLATLEALSCGCKVVVSEADFCPVDTYFRGLVNRVVFVCDPYEPRSIRLAIEEALDAKDTPELDEWRARFSWKEAARQTFTAYRQVVPS